MRFALFIALLCTATSAPAGVPCENISAWTEGETRVVLISPAGTAPSLADQGVVIHVEVMDCTPEPVVGYPFQDIWVGDTGTGEINLCQNGSMADADTDENGRTTISGRVFGGDHTELGTMVWVAGMPMDTGPLPLDFVSPDLDGDLDVDLMDFSIFGMDFQQAGVVRSDFVPDGVIDLYDFSVFGSHFGDQCP